jgi:hypothetical protein
MYTMSWESRHPFVQNNSRTHGRRPTQDLFGGSDEGRKEGRNVKEGRKEGMRRQEGRGVKEGRNRKGGREGR